MTHNELVQNLLENKDEKYKEFHVALVPGIPPKSFIGVRVPILRKLAKDFYKSSDRGTVIKFMRSLPHKYFEENHIHAMILEQIKDFDECLECTEKFLPYINNWAICDGKKPRALLKKQDVFLERIFNWVQSDHPYVVRFGINMLMDLFLDERFDPKFLKWVANVDTEKFGLNSDGSLPQCVASATPKGVTLANPQYYVRMEIAWYFATALAKQWDASLCYIQNKLLDDWTHNKAIQKAAESYRVSAEHKEILRKMKI